eukprot:Clim_evm31s128 gene=Clim_evmTU31s128
MLVLVIGDMHIPHRRAALPAKFRKLLVPGRIQHILGTGNLCSKDQIEYFQTLAGDVQCVRGDFDIDQSLPEELVMHIGDWKVGVIHGHQILPAGNREGLAMVQRKLNVDVLLSGNTHTFEAYDIAGNVFINPGSATGAPNEDGEEAVPSFVLMDIQGPKMVVYYYALHNQEVKVEKREFTRNADVLAG